MEYRQREVLFREAVIGFICGTGKETPEDEYCRICRQAGKATDCETCPRTINVITPKGDK